MKDLSHKGNGDLDPFDEGIKVLMKVLAERSFTLKVQASFNSEGSQRGGMGTVEPGHNRLRIRTWANIHAALNAKGTLNHLKNGPPEDRTLAIVPRLTLGTIDECREHGLCAVDADGNFLLTLPGLHLERYRQHVRSVRPTTSGSIFTARASRIVRALFAKHPKACRQIELVEWTKVSPGHVSNSIRAMEAEGYVSRDNESVRLSDPDRLLTDWSARYRFDRHLRRRYALAMASYEQGVEKVKIELSRLGIRHAFTGWTGAYLLAPYGEPETIMAYSAGLPDEDKLKALQPVENGGNVILLVPHDEGVFQFGIEGVNHTPIVSHAQLYVDLTRMPGRAPEQAEVIRKKFLRFDGSNP